MSTVSLARATGFLLAAALLTGAAERPAIIDAARTGNRELLKSLIQKKADVNAPDGDGSTALHWSSYRDDLESTDMLLRAGAHANAANDLGVTPLWTASLNGSLPLVRRLLEGGAEPNRALVSGETPLMVAARGGYAVVVQALLSAGANPNASGSRRQTALMWAVAQKHPEAVKALIGGGADIHARSESWSQMMAVPPHGLPEYNRMIPHGNDTALMFAARVGDLESARFLVAAGANVNDEDASGVSATTLAAHSGFGDLVEFLVGKGADPNAGRAGFTALQCAIMQRDEKAVAALLAAGADPNIPVKVWTPTRRSSEDFHFMPALVGATPFWLAARFTQPGAMRLLARHGADPLVIHTAEFAAGESYVMRREVTNAAQAAVGMGGGTAWVSIAPDQREALMLETLSLAVELGADINAANTDGKTALDAAKSLKYPTVIKFLEDRDAKAGIPLKK